ncbi:MAG: integrin alpha [Polyangiales bacterium]
MNLANDARNCGACDNVCAPVANGSTQCAAGSCAVSGCNPGFADCDGLVTNGCETNVQTELTNCGACGRTCPSYANAASVCLTGRCYMSECRAGYANCDGSESNGCEQSTSGDVLNCGGCARPCATATNAVPLCTSGTCSLQCIGGFANCDGDWSNGCEVNTNTSTAHCGACRRTCPAIANGTTVCSAATCTLGSCAAGFHALGGVCVANTAARLITPVSLGETTLRRPTLRFELPTGADGAVIELCLDRGCSMPLETLRVSATSARPTTALPAGRTIFWRARARVGSVEDSAAFTSSTWIFHTPLVDNSGGIDTSHSPHLDVNGDGFDDVAIGVPRGTTAIPTGTVSVYHGSATGIAAIASSTLNARALDAMAFGTAVANLGDFNGDGFGDLIVGAPESSITAYRGGAVFLFFG